MPDPFADWYDHTVTVDTITAAGDWGATTTTTHPGVPCMVESTNSVVISPEGSEVRATSVLYAAISDRPKFTPGSTVTLPDGRKALVLSVDSADSDPDLGGITVHLA